MKPGTLAGRAEWQLELRLAMSNAAIVEPKPVETEQILQRRPATRRALAACLVLGTAAAIIRLRFAAEPLALLFVVASALTGVLTLLLRLLERPRPVKVRKFPPPPSGPVIH